MHVSRIFFSSLFYPYFALSSFTLAGSSDLPFVPHFNTEKHTTCQLGTLFSDLVKNLPVIGSFCYVYYRFPSLSFLDWSTIAISE